MPTRRRPPGRRRGRRRRPRHAAREPDAAALDAHPAVSEVVTFTRAFEDPSFPGLYSLPHEPIGRRSRIRAPPSARTVSPDGRAMGVQTRDRGRAGAAVAPRLAPFDVAHLRFADVAPSSRPARLPPARRARRTSPSRPTRTRCSAMPRPPGGSTARPSPRRIWSSSSLPRVARRSDDAREPPRSPCFRDPASRASFGSCSGRPSTQSAPTASARSPRGSPSTLPHGKPSWPPGRAICSLASAIATLPAERAAPVAPHGRPA